MVGYHNLKTTFIFISRDNNDPGTPFHLIILVCLAALLFSYVYISPKQGQPAKGIFHIFFHL